MGLAPYFLNTMGSGKSKKNKKNAKAQEQHKQWLAEKGLLNLKPVKRTDTFVESYESKSTVPLSNAVGNGYKNDLWEKLLKSKETEETLKEIKIKASRSMPLYNKGGLQYATPGMDLTTVGSKSRRG